MKKQVITLLAGATLFSTTFSPLSVGAQAKNSVSMKTTIDDKKIDVKISDGEFTITDELTHETATVIFTEENPVLIDEEGNETELLTTQDDSGNVYANGELIGTRIEYYDKNEALADGEKWDSQFSSKVSYRALNKSEINPRPNAKYNYYSTIKTNAFVRGSISAIAATVASLVPFLSITTAVAGIIDTFLSLRRGMMYIKQHSYHTSGYRYYRYDTGYFKHSNYRGIEGVTKQYQTMW